MSTFFVTDERMLKHRCEWDAHHIERPERLSRILSKLKSTGILDECTKLSSRHATIDELTIVHDEEYVRKVESTAGLTMLEQEDFSSQFEDIYVNESTWDTALLSAGCALELTAAVWREGRGANGFAAIRPPGHHASRDQGCGFCLFNNVVLSAKQALAQGAERVLILDFDVHAGQGTQYAIADDSRIRLISIHRYEEGHFWPQLPESASKNEYENTLNVPLNRVGYGDFDYAALMHSIVLPLVGEWQPDVVLVSCGFDAAIGDPEGEMEVTPAGFAWMCGVLAAQEIPLVLLLEGGYFVESVGESAHSVLRALIERNPSFLFSLDCVLPADLLSVISAALFVLKEKWGIGVVASVNAVRTAKDLPPFEDVEVVEYKGVREFSLPCPTRHVYPPRQEGVEEHFHERLHELIKERKSVRAEAEVVRLLVDEKHSTVELVIRSEVHKLPLRSECDLRFFFHYVLLPLALKFRIDCKLEHPFRLSSFEQKFHRLDRKATIVSAELAAVAGSLPKINGLFN